MTVSNGPLSGVKIIEMDAIGPVPLACMMLADQGAEIIRIGRKTANAAWGDDEMGAAVMHRSRKTVYLNLKDESERALLLELIGKADAIIDGFRPGVMEKLELGPDICLEKNPGLVFVRMTGWGQSGPMAMRAGHDINYISLTGALHAIGKPGEVPPVPLNLVGDYGGGAMLLLFGLLSAIISAKASGKGDVVDVAMVDGTSSLMAMFWALKGAGLFTPRNGENMLDGSAPYYRCYECSDGKYVAVGCLEPQFFAQMIDGLGLVDRDYQQTDLTEWPRMEADFTALFASKSRDEWTAIFDGTDACVTPVLDMDEAPQHPHLAAREIFTEVDGMLQPMPSPRFAAQNSKISPPREAVIEDLIARW